MTRRGERGTAVTRILAPLRRRERQPRHAPGSRRGNLVGRDLAPIRRRADRRRGLLFAALVGALMAALCLAALRIDLIRQGYALAAAMREEKELLEEHRLLTARVRSLRDPARLAHLAGRLGFERPVRVIEISPPEVPVEPRP